MTIRLPLDQGHPVRPPGNLRDLQVQGPVHRVRAAAGDPAWLVTGCRELQELSGDSRLGRSHPEPGTAARWGDPVPQGGPRGNYATEPQDHARFRARVQPRFSPRRMRGLRSRAGALTAELAGRLAASQPPADLIQALALPLPAAVICELPGVPLQDREMSREWTQPAAGTRDRARSQHGLLSLCEYGQRLAARKHTGPGDDIISGWCADPEVPGDAVAMVAMSLLRAGHESTVDPVGTGALLLLTQPRQRQALDADPALVPAAAEEAPRAAGRGGTPLIRPAHQLFPPDAAGHAHRGTHGNRRALAPGTDRPARYLAETAGWSGRAVVRSIRGEVTDLARVMLPRYDAMPRHRNRCRPARDARSYSLCLALPQTGYRSGAGSGVRRHGDDDNDPGQLQTRPISADRAPDPMAEATLKTATRAPAECSQVQNENICVQVRRCNARAPTANIRYGASSSGWQGGLPGAELGDRRPGMLIRLPQRGRSLIEQGSSGGATSRRTV
ncbi:MAG TPA: hypothetical protein VFQ68_12145, partial [Streptosporangiaceae bacterium]|nr:hypothetical protein [Streptosporangiaceae bacterium]